MVGADHRVAVGQPLPSTGVIESPPDVRVVDVGRLQHEALRRLVTGGVVSLEEGLRMAGETPARALGLEDELGRLVPGARADLVVLGEDLALAEVLVGGRPLTESGSGSGAAGR